MSVRLCCSDVVPAVSEFCYVVLMLSLIYTLNIIIFQVREISESSSRNT